MEAMRKKSWREGLYLQSTNFSMDHDQYRAWMQDWTGRVTDYTIQDNSDSTDSAAFTVDVTITADGEDYILKGETFKVSKENTIWRVKPSPEFLELLTLEHETEQNNEE